MNPKRKPQINLLTNFPLGECTEPLMLPLNKEMIKDSISKEIEYNEKCMNGPQEILDFLVETLVEVTFFGITILTYRVLKLLPVTYLTNDESVCL